MTGLAISIVKHLLRALLYGIPVTVLLALIGFVWFLNQQPELEIWHQARLDEEFRAGSDTDSFAAYLQLEDRLFAQLQREVVDRVDEQDRQLANRFYAESLTTPEIWPRNWNRSFELFADEPKAGVLLLHGMSDSPYSLRHPAMRLNGAGMQVLGLRVPGHGTAPSGLVDVSWEDMAAAVELALEHLRDQVGDRPLFLIGYSNGAALGLHHACVAVDDPDLPQLDGIVLLSPMLGVTPAAAFAIWQERIGEWLGLDKLRWTSVLPEYDPFKYQSFAVNAGDQTYRLTQDLHLRLDDLRARGEMDRFPPVLAFSSAVDATVSVPDLITQLMDRLPERGHELVLLDINRTAAVEHLLTNDPRQQFRELLGGRELPYALAVISNRNDTDLAVVEFRKLPGDSEVIESELGLSWPESSFSLSHVALPFPEHDPMYGPHKSDTEPGLALGGIALRGERGVLRIPADEMLRQRWNPFYPYLERRILDFLDVD